MSRWILKVVEIKISTALSRVTVPVELNEMVQYKGRLRTTAPWCSATEKACAHLRTSAQHWNFWVNGVREGSCGRRKKIKLKRNKHASRVNANSNTQWWRELCKSYYSSTVWHKSNKIPAKSQSSRMVPPTCQLPSWVVTWPRTHGSLIFDRGTRSFFPSVSPPVLHFSAGLREPVLYLSPARCTPNHQKVDEIP